MTRPTEEESPQRSTSAQTLPNPVEVNEFHRYDDVDNNTESHHHTLGTDPNQSSPGDHNHDGRNSKALASTAIPAATKIAGKFTLTQENVASTTYVAAATATEVSIVVGASGIVFVDYGSAVQINSPGGTTYVGIETVGTLDGFGAYTGTASDSVALITYHPQAATPVALAGAPQTHSGYTPGTTFTAKLRFRVNTGTGTFKWRQIRLLTV